MGSTGGKTPILARIPYSALYGLIALALCPASARTQEAAAPPPVPIPSPIERGIDLAGKRRCDEALPLLHEFTPGLTDKQLRYDALLATARCAIHQRDGRGTVNALMALRHDYPKDPEVLYLTTQVFLEIAVHASRELTAVAPNSYQVRLLEAESFESQSNWEGAAETYRKILQEHPKLPSIHFRLARAVLSQPESPERTEAARKEFEQELAVDPANASAEYWLGQIARRGAFWDDAISHLNAALKLDPALAAAWLALGMTFNSADRFPDAIVPLERYTSMSPEDPAGHYQLALAYRRTGRKEDAARELARHQELLEKRQGKPASSIEAEPR